MSVISNKGGKENNSRTVKSRLCGSRAIISVTFRYLGPSWVKVAHCGISQRRGVPQNLDFGPCARSEPLSIFPPERHRHSPINQFTYKYSDHD